MDFFSVPSIINTVVTLLLLTFHHSNGQLQVGFYTLTCPNAESIVSSVVRDGTKSNPSLPAALLRLHFHDCFVDGCDGSILIDKSDGTAEKTAFGHEGVHGFDIVDRAKEELEKECPGVVSCSDVVALMARDAIALSNGPSYMVPTGRRDGLVSNVRHADEMPDVHDSIEKLTQKFAQKGLSQKDMVVLNAAHTIGTTACFFVTDRLYGSSRPEQSINPNFLPELQKTCPENGPNNVRLPLDRGSEGKFDNKIFGNIRDGFSVIRSDAAMYEDPSTQQIVDGYLDGGIFGSSFERDFAVSVTRMGSIGVLTGDQGLVNGATGNIPIPTPANLPPPISMATPSQADVDAIEE